MALLEIQLLLRHAQHRGNLAANGIFDVFLAVLSGEHLFWRRRKGKAPLRGIEPGSQSLLTSTSTRFKANGFKVRCDGWAGCPGAKIRDPNQNLPALVQQQQIES